MKPGWFILKVSLLLPKMIILFSLSLGQYWVSAMHLHPFYSVTWFFEKSYLPVIFIDALFLFLRWPTSFLLCSLAPLFITSEKKKMVFLKFSTQALFTFHYPVSFAGFLRCTWRKRIDKNPRQRSANLLTCDCDISLDIKNSKVFWHV